MSQPAQPQAGSPTPSVPAASSQPPTRPGTPRAPSPRTMLNPPPPFQVANPEAPTMDKLKEYARNAGIFQTGVKAIFNFLGVPQNVQPNEIHVRVASNISQAATIWRRCYGLW